MSSLRLNRDGHAKAGGRRELWAGQDMTLLAVHGAGAEAETREGLRGASGDGRSGGMAST